MIPYYILLEDITGVFHDNVANTTNNTISIIITFINISNIDGDSDHDSDDDDGDFYGEVDDDDDVFADKSNQINW